MATMEKLTHVSEINQLVSQGKEKGYLTYEEVNDVLPADVVTPEQIDDLMALFSELMACAHLSRSLSST